MLQTPLGRALKSPLRSVSNRLLGYDMHTLSAVVMELIRAALMPGSYASVQLRRSVCRCGRTRFRLHCHRHIRHQLAVVPTVVDQPNRKENAFAEAARPSRVKRIVFRPHRQCTIGAIAVDRSNHAKPKKPLGNVQSAGCYLSLRRPMRVRVLLCIYAPIPGDHRMTPADWITRRRVDQARELLECPGLSIDQIAARTGLRTATTLRHHFRRKVGVGPVEYRRQFSQTVNPQGRDEARNVRM
jgi:hypothetical protein